MTFDAYLQTPEGYTYLCSADSPTEAIMLARQSGEMIGGVSCIHVQRSGSALPAGRDGFAEAMSRGPDGMPQGRKAERDPAICREIAEHARRTGGCSLRSMGRQLAKIGLVTDARAGYRIVEMYLCKGRGGGISGAQILETPMPGGSGRSWRTVIASGGEG